MHEREAPPSLFWAQTVLGFGWAVKCRRAQTARFARTPRGITSPPIRLRNSSSDTSGEDFAASEALWWRKKVWNSPGGGGFVYNGGHVIADTRRFA